MSATATRLLRAARTALALLALFAAATGQVGSCNPDHRDRPIQRVPDAALPEGLRGGAPPVSRGDRVRMNVLVSPSPAKVGQAIRYLAVVRADRDQKVRFDPPRSGGEFTWSELRAGREHPMWWKQSANLALDSVWFEARLQVFTTGLISIPGPVVRLDPLPNSTGPGFTRLPTAHLVVTPTVTSADSNQSLRGLHGPLGAPWWERVPLVAIVVGLGLLVAWVFVLRQLRRRVRKPVRRTTAPLAPPLRPRLDPAAEALRALFTLRAKKLPAQQRFGEHALELTAILRRFLEATVATPRPGDTSGELLERLKASRLDQADLERLEGLLGLWDRVKFARAPLTEAEAARCEDAVEGYVRRVAQARFEAEAAAARAAAARAAAETGPGRKPPRGPAAAPPARPSASPPSGTSPRPAPAASGSMARPSGVGPRPSPSTAGPSPARPGNRPNAPEAA
jgi:hypothetical protein